MAIITSEKLSLEIRFREIDEHNHIQYDAWLRYDGRPVINPSILARDDPYWGDRRGDSLRAADGSADGVDDALISTLQQALESNQPRAWQPFYDGFSLYIYPEVFFPPLSKDDFDVLLDPPRADSGIHGSLSAPDDTISLYIQTDLINLGARRGSSGLGMQLSVERHELQDFIDDLKYEYTELLQRYPRHQDSLRSYKVLQLAFDGAPRMLEIYLFQGEMRGWVHLNLTVDGIQRTVWASQVFSPFRAIVSFLTAVAEDRLPAECWIDEEGAEVVFRAERWGEPHLFRFQMISPEKPLYQTHMDYVFDRRQFVLAFYNDLISFQATHFQPQFWGDAHLAPPECLDALRRALDTLGDTP